MSNPGRVLQAVLVVLLAAAPSGCATGSVRGAGQEYQGHLSLELDRTIFRPCNPAPGDTLWLATFQGMANAQLERLSSTGALGLPRPVHVRVFAQVSAPDPIGAARYRATREIYVRDILASRPSAPCDPA